MAKPTGASFSRRAPDNITEELVAALSSKASFEFKALFAIIFQNLRERNAASGGEEMLRLRCYEKLQSLANRGLVKKTGKSYAGLKGLEQASSVFQFAKMDAAAAAAAAASATATATAVAS